MMPMKMMRLTKNQCGIINAAVKPFRLTSRYLNDKLARILMHHLKYYAKCRHIISHGRPIQQHNHYVTLQFNKLSKKGGFIHKRLPITWSFYGALLLTRFGRDEQRRVRRRKRARSASHKAAGSGKSAANAAPAKKLKAIVDNAAAAAHASGSASAIELFRITSNNGTINIRDNTCFSSDYHESDGSVSTCVDATRSSFSDQHNEGTVLRIAQLQMGTFVSINRTFASTTFSIIISSQMGRLVESK